MKRSLPALLFLCLGGCASEPEQVLDLPQWTLHPGEGRTPVDVTARALYAPLLAPGPGHYRLTTRVALPEALRGKQLSLTMLDFEAPARLHVNGIAGEPLSTRHKHPGWSLPARATHSAELTIELDADYLKASGANLLTPPRLSDRPMGDARYLRARTLNDAINASSALLLALFMAMYVLSYALDRSHAAHGWLVLASLAFIPIPLNYFGLLFPVFGPWDDAAAMVSATLGQTAMFYVGASTFGRPRPSIAWWAVAATAAGVVALAPDPTRIWWGLWLVGVVFPGVSQLYVALCSRHGLKSELLRPVALVFVAVFSTLTIYQGALLAWIVLKLPMLAAGRSIIYLPLLIAGITMALGFVLERWSALRESRRLNVELQRRLSELEVTSAELRHQVADRSQQLAQALSTASRSTPAALVPGELVNGRYRALRALGSGGMGTVYEVERVADGARFALKMLRSHAHGDAMARLAREAQIAASFRHENLVTVVDIGFSAAGALFIVMELVQGTSLDAERRRFGDVRWGLDVLAGIAEGLAVLHRAGIVHRDLKPGNVLLGSGDPAIVKIADFGIARLVEPRPTEELSLDAPTLRPQGAAQRLTRMGELIGTPMYMAPELAAGADAAGPEADLFSYGVIAHEVLTGALPFEVPAIFASSAGGPPPKCRVDPGLARADAQLPALIEQLLHPTPGERPTAADILAVLARLHRGTAGAA